MAKQDLHRLLEQISAELHTSLRENVDTFPHVLEISAKHIENHLLLQLTEILQPDRRSRTHTLATRHRGAPDIQTGEAALFSETENIGQLVNTPSQEAKIRKVVAELSQDYAQRVLSELKRNAKNYTLEVTGSNTEYRVKVTYVGPKVTLNTAKPEFLQKNPSDVFRFIREKGLQPARDYVRRSLTTQLKGILPTGFTKETIFDLGHITAVSSIKIGRAMSRLEQLRRTATYSKILEDTLDFQMFSKFSSLGDPEVAKQFEGHVAYARPEAATFNNWQSTYEANLLKEVQQAFKKILGDKSDWATQGGSDSIVEFIAKDLLSTAAKHGAKVEGTSLKKNTKSSKDRIKDRAKRKETTIHVSGNESIDVPEMRIDPGPTAVNIRNLIPMLNERLPEFVRANMGLGGRLVNRTGRFAESTQIVDIGDNGVISYTYMRHPYQVFESQGPRDPRPLIDQSIRELARGIITSKFTTRRI